MPRQARLDAPGVLHHVIFRGIERRNIFKDNDDRNNLLERLEVLLPETRIFCYAWALLPNHAHFLFRTGDVPLSTLMRRLLTGYVVRFNKKYRRHGHLLQNRYRSIICQEDIYFRELVRYIHLNPLRLQIVSSISELSSYEYSGHSALVGKKKRNWQDGNYVLSVFGRTKKEALQAYLSYLEKGINQGQRPELLGGGLIRSLGGWREAKSRRPKREGPLKGDQRILGESDFVEEILAEAEENFERSYELKSKGYDLETIEARVCEIYGIDKSEIFSGGRQQILADARGLYCYWATRMLGYSLTEIARRLKRTVSGVGYAAQRGARIAKENGYELIKREVI
jgi:REP element-mobilizing transposase RayT